VGTFGINLETDDLAAVEIKDQIQTPCSVAQHQTSVGPVAIWSPGCPPRLGSPSAIHLSLWTQHKMVTGLAGDKIASSATVRDNPRRRRLGKMWRVGHRDNEIVLGPASAQAGASRALDVADQDLAVF
jgi:hypothetical protein